MKISDEEYYDFMRKLRAHYDLQSSIPFPLSWRGNDTTYCGSENCMNLCGRKLILPMEFKKRMDEIDPNWHTRIWYANFCDETGEPIQLTGDRKW